MEIANRLFDEVGLNKREAKEFVDAYFETIKAAYKGGYEELTQRGYWERKLA